MTRFLAALFAARTPAAARRPSLGMESLEARDTPSGMIGHALSKISHAVHSHGLPHLHTTATLASIFTPPARH